MEEMLIARVTVRCACKSDGQKAVNSVIKITLLSIFVELPRLPEDTASDVIIIRKDAVDMSGHVDFMVRREKVKAALEYKITNVTPIMLI